VRLSSALSGADLAESNYLGNGGLIITLPLSLKMEAAQDLKTRNSADKNHFALANHVTTRRDRRRAPNQSAVLRGRTYRKSVSNKYSKY
jgi:hypothetical protein